MISYLSYRYSYVHFNVHYSKSSQTLFGVPQGSILGPLLFKLFINDIESFISFSSIILYADDTVLLIGDSNVSSLVAKVNSDLSSIASYCFNNQLCLNASKSSVVIFNNPNHHDFTDAFKINKDSLPIVEDVKYLGYYIDQKLSFKQHVLHITKKLSACNSILSRASLFLPKEPL